MLSLKKDVGLLKNTFVRQFRLDLTKYESKDNFYFRSLFVLRFYGPVNPVGSCPAESVYLTTLLLGRPLLSSKGIIMLCTVFCQKLTNALLESAEGKELL